LSIHVFDFFCGCGGTSAGFRAAGLEIRLGIDIDGDSQKTFEANFPEAVFLQRDVYDLPVETLEPYLDSEAVRLFCCCAPCQPFSKQNKQRDTTKKEALLLYEFARFVEHYEPELIFLENVPGLQNIDAGSGRFGDFVTFLKYLNYSVAYEVIESQDYGVPQQRKRLILLASRLRKIEFPPKTHGLGKPHPSYSTVWEWIKSFPPIAAGETHSTVPNHRAAKLSKKNLRRIKATPPGGGRLDWPKGLVLECHKKEYTGHTDVYGRMHKDRPASGLTTRCISLSNGRFGHPEQHRAISVREAASIQTFPENFVFVGSLNSMARQVGNAVPVLIAEIFGKYFVSHCETYRAIGAN
jgi:DNA (cytosine-5)-methyltransferase 1